MNTTDHSPPTPLRLAVFVGSHGRGSNLMAIHTAIGDGRLSARVVCVIGTRSDAPAIARAKESDLPTRVLSPKDRSEEEYGDALLKALRGAGAEAIALAGYMRRMPSAVVAAYRHRIINIHPALLPAFGGKGMYGEHVHRGVLEYGAKVSGCTVHFIDEEYDTGPVILQKVVPVEEGDTPQSLAARILPLEHAAYVEALQLLAEGRLSVEGRIVHVAPPPTPGV
ncbi:MAG TPA: phosphoribosylglycinamide formyltransferase [Armatimonadaceae bacterium]|nr:phosphoribosylglycinamide formyltransferase [Armatimonadaceae bacterium]